MPAADGDPTRNADAGIAGVYRRRGASAENALRSVTVVLYSQLVPGVFHLPLKMHGEC